MQYTKRIVLHSMQNILSNLKRLNIEISKAFRENIEKNKVFRIGLFLPFSYSNENKLNIGY